MIAIVGLGVVGVLVTHWLGFLLKIEESYWFWGLGAAFFLLVSFVAGMRAPKPLWRLVPFILLGIAVGTILDAVIQPIWHNRDSNLWPLGILIWWVIGILPISVGVAIARIVRRSE